MEGPWDTSTVMVVFFASANRKTSPPHSWLSSFSKKTERKASLFEAQGFDKVDTMKLLTASVRLEEYISVIFGTIASSGILSFRP